MTGEIVRARAICLDVRPWSRTSHVVSWLTPEGKVATVVKGAVRPKSAFLGQYDLNYTCEILYYATARGDLHALRECSPLERREGLRTDCRILSLTGYFRHLVGELAPDGPDCRAWYDLLSESLDVAAAGRPPLTAIVRFDLQALRLVGLAPDFSGYDRNAPWSVFSVEKGAFDASGGRAMRVSREVARCLAAPDETAENEKIPLDAARVIGVFYQFHMDCVSRVRRLVLEMIS